MKQEDVGVENRAMSVQTRKSNFLSLEYVQQVLQENKDILVRFGASRVGLFGSFVRGEADETSDIDLLIEFVEGKKSYDNFIELCFFLEELLGRKVDLLTPSSVPT